MSRMVAVASSFALLVGCASVNPQPAFVDVQKSVEQKTGRRPEWVRTPAEGASTAEIVRNLLKEELTAARAVQVAFLNNPGLQATFEELGISQADLAQAALVENPELAGLVRFPSAGSGRNTELSFVLNVIDVFIAPIRKKVAAAELEQTKARVADQVLGLAAEVKTAFFTLQARQHLVKRLRMVLDLTQTAEEFARRQHEASTIPDLALENQIAINRQAKVDVALAEAEVRADRERLNRLLGVWGADTAWRTADELPVLPATEIPLAGLESQAIQQRQDLQAARWGVDLVGRALALKRKTRFFPVGFNVGISTEKDVTGERVTGPELALQLPIFDTGRASIARLEAEHRRAQRQLEGLAINARSEVREARDRMLAARDLSAYYRDVLLPQRVRILDLTLRYYNLMFKGVYDLLLAKQQHVETERAYIDAWRDYWVARAELERALGGALPEAVGIGSSAREEN